MRINKHQRTSRVYLSVGETNRVSRQRLTIAAWVLACFCAVGTVAVLSGDTHSGTLQTSASASDAGSAAGGSSAATLAVGGITLEQSPASTTETGSTASTGPQGTNGTVGRSLDAV